MSESHACNLLRNVYMVCYSISHIFERIFSLDEGGGRGPVRDDVRKNSCFDITLLIHRRGS